MNLTKSAELIIKIRVFEEKILDLFSQNKLSGTTHTCIGQEAVAVAALSYISKGDHVFSNHRCHGHYIAYGGSSKALLSEIMSKSNGLCQGRGGSQHIRFNEFYSNGIQGGIVPGALGMAFADKLNNNNTITIVFIGDGTLGQGIVYECFNMASLFKIPILFIIENNQYAMSTSVNSAVSGTIAERSKAFGIKTEEITSNDIEVLDEIFKKAICHVKEDHSPFCQIVNTYRLSPHSKGDDHRDVNEINTWKTKDPIAYLEMKLGKDFCENIKEKYQHQMQDFINEIEKEDYLYVKKYTDDYNKSISWKDSNESFLANNNEKVLVHIRSALEELLESEKNIVILGEDISDPYGGTFKVTKGLSERYVGKIINTPISESCIAGTGVGMAMNGIKPIVEIMFGDFISLCFDQLLNHAVKYGWIYGSNINIPVIYRVPMGGGRGYGPTHSQSLEKFLVGIPFLKILALSTLFDVKKLFRFAVSGCKTPLIIIENKKMYGERTRKCTNGRIGNFYVEEVKQCTFPSIKLSLDKNMKCDVGIITYGGMVELAMEAAEELMLRDEISIEIIVLSQISPVPKEDIMTLLTSDIVGTLEEGTLANGIGAELISILSETRKASKFFRLGTQDCPIPNGSILEEQVFPNKKDIIDIIKKYND